MAVQEQTHKLSRGSTQLVTYSRGNMGPWVVLINGHTRPASDFRAFMRNLEEHGYASATLDNRGSGATRYSEPFTLSDMVDDVAALMTDLGIERAHLLGISMGGVIAQHFAARLPGCVNTLALVSTTCQTSYMTADETPWKNDLAEIVAKMRPYFSEAFFSRNKLLIDAMCKQIFKSIGNGDFAKGASDQRRALDSFDTVNLLAKIQCPVGVFHGGADQIISPAVADEFERHLPKLKRKIYPGVGHLLLAECPKQLYEDYLEFLRDFSN